MAALLLTLADRGVAWLGLDRAVGTSLYCGHPTRLWALRPGGYLPEDREPKEVQVNSLGLRGREQGPREGSRRILLLGDSVLFGMGLKNPETLDVALEAALAEASPQPVQVFNAAVPGYSTLQVRDQLDELLPELRPQAVILPILCNDAAGELQEDATLLPAPWTAPARRLLWRTSLGQFALSRSLAHSMPYDPLRPEGQGARIAPSGPAVMRVPVSSYGPILEDIVARCRRAGVEQVVFLRLPTFRGEAESGRPSPHVLTFQEVARAEGAPLVDTCELWQGADAARYFLGDSQHLTPEGNRALARLLTRVLVKPGDRR